VTLYVALGGEIRKGSPQGATADRVVLAQGLLAGQLVPGWPLAGAHLEKQIFFDLVVQGDSWMRLEAIFRRCRASLRRQQGDRLVHGFRHGATAVWPVGMLTGLACLKIF
jgi:hypothetical protein